PDMIFEAVKKMAERVRVQERFWSSPLSIAPNHVQRGHEKNAAGTEAVLDEVRIVIHARHHAAAGQTDWVQPVMLPFLPLAGGDISFDRIRGRHRSFEMN